MKKYIIIVVSIFSCAFFACGDGYEPAREINPDLLNEKLALGVQNRAEWVKTPESIVRELLPKAVQEEGNATYSYKEKRVSGDKRQAIIIEEGLIDDEVSGIKTIVDFKAEDDRWKIVKITQAIKRHD